MRDHFRQERAAVHMRQAMVAWHQHAAANVSLKASALCAWKQAVNWQRRKPLLLKTAASSCQCRCDFPCTHMADLSGRMCCWQPSQDACYLALVSKVEGSCLLPHLASALQLMCYHCCNKDSASAQMHVKCHVLAITKPSAAQTTHAVGSHQKSWSTDCVLTINHRN